MSDAVLLALPSLWSADLTRASFSPPPEHLPGRYRMLLKVVSRHVTKSQIQDPR